MISNTNPAKKATFAALLADGLGSIMHSVTFSSISLSEIHAKSTLLRYTPNKGMKIFD